MNRVCKWGGAMNAPSPMQLRVIQMEAQGMTPKEIAAALGRAPNTVSQHIYQFRLRFGTRNVAGDCRWLLENGLHPFQETKG